MYACNGILFNHESPLRGETFVTRKITRALARISLGLQECLYLGNLKAKRDWGHAKDYVRMQWMMLQQSTPQDYVIATGIQYSVKDFVSAATGELGMTLGWEGEDQNEIGRIVAFDPAMWPALKKGQVIVRVDPRYFRPTEVETLLGDPTKARTQLGWVPAITFPELVAEMMRADLDSARRDQLARAHGHRTYNNHED
jgi:GDPmannose 4,6-dehydratase